MRELLDILLVEDNEGDIEIARRALKSAMPQCQMSVAHNGDQALEQLRKRQAETPGKIPDIILLDINMPRMNGKQFLSEVKADDALKAIPVVMFTSSQSVSDIRECYERQASCYVVKPFDLHAYTDALHQVVTFWGDRCRLPE